MEALYKPEADNQKIQRPCVFRESLYFPLHKLHTFPFWLYIFQNMDFQHNKIFLSLLKMPCKNLHLHFQESVLNSPYTLYFQHLKQEISPISHQYIHFLLSL